MNGNPRDTSKRDSIMAATYKLLQNNGYSNTSISSVKKETGASASSIYWMFQDKDTLICETLEAQYPARKMAEDWAHFSREIPVIDQLRHQLSLVLESEQRGRAVRTGLILALEGTAQSLPIQKPYRRRRTEAMTAFRKWWAQALAALHPEDSHISEEATQRMGALTQWFLDGHFIGDRYLRVPDTDQRIELMAQVLLAAAQSDFISASQAGHEEYSNPPQEPSTDLLGHVRRLVAEHGYEGATFSRICRAAGVARSSIYWKYEDKDALIKEAFVEPYLNMKGTFAGLPHCSRTEVPSVLTAELIGTNRRLHRTPLVATGGLLIAAQRREPPTPAGSAMIEGSRASERRLANWLHGMSLETLPTLGNSIRAAWLFNRLRIGMVAEIALGDNTLRLSEEMILGTIAQLRSQLLAR